MKKAFTLIELLVVIAIIGILAAMVLVSLGSARTKAKDTRVLTAVSGYRSASEMYFSDNSNYTNVCTATADTYGLGNLRADVTVQGGTNGCTAVATQWSFYSKLPSAGVAAFPATCSDSTGQANTYKTGSVTAPTGGAACPASN